MQYEMFGFITNGNLLNLLIRIKEAHPPLIQMAEIKDGVKTGDNEQYVSRSLTNSAYKPLLTNSDIERYLLQHNGLYLLYDRALLARAREERIFLAPSKLVVRQTGDRITAAVDRSHIHLITHM
jgi:adenine-specific DNA-methyltransferase